MKNPFAAYQRPRLFALEPLGDLFETEGPGLPPFADREQYEECLRWADAYYERPSCRRCSWPTSRRSTKALFVEDLDDRRDSEGVHIGRLAPRTSLVLSTRFLGALTAEERAGLELLAVDAPKSREGFFELVGPHQVRPVALASVAPSGWFCSGCGQAYWGYWVPGSRLRMFVRAEDAPASGGGVFVVRDANTEHLVVTAECLARLRAEKVMRGLQGIPVGVVPGALATDSPELAEIEARRHFEMPE